MLKFSITDKLSDEIVEVTEAGLLATIKEMFHEANSQFHSFLFNRILNSANTPFNNERYTIRCTNPKALKHKTLNTKGLPASETLDIGQKRLYNEWIMFNLKTGKNHAFHNLAALSRALNINYTWLYTHVANVNTLKIGHCTITRASVLEKEYYQIKLNEVL